MLAQARAKPASATCCGALSCASQLSTKVAPPGERAEQQQEPAGTLMLTGFSDDSFTARVGGLPPFQGGVLSMQCSSCGLENPPTARQCDCGAPLGGGVQ